jgi:hypothetical protein
LSPLSSMVFQFNPVTRYPSLCQRPLMAHSQAPIAYCPTLIKHNLPVPFILIRTVRSLSMSKRRLTIISR